MKKFLKVLGVAVTVVGVVTTLLTIEIAKCAKLNEELYGSSEDYIE